VIVSGARNPGTESPGWNAGHVRCHAMFATIHNANAIRLIRERRRDASIRRSCGISLFFIRPDDKASGVLGTGQIRTGFDMAFKGIIALLRTSMNIPRTFLETQEFSVASLSVSYWLVPRRKRRRKRRHPRRRPELQGCLASMSHWAQLPPAFGMPPVIGLCGGAWREEPPQER